MKLSKRIHVLVFVLFPTCLLGMDGGQSITKFIFPQPTGQYAVGTKLFELTDVTRNDQETSAPRELVVQVWYPAQGIPGTQTAPYAYEAREIYKRDLAAQGLGEEKTQCLILFVRTQFLKHQFAVTLRYTHL